MDYPTHLFEAAIKEKIDLPNGMYFSDWQAYNVRVLPKDGNEPINFTADKGMKTIHPQSRNVVVKDNVGYILRQNASMALLFQWMGYENFR